MKILHQITLYYKNISKFIAQVRPVYEPIRPFSHSYCDRTFALSVRDNIRFYCNTGVSWNNTSELFKFKLMSLDYTWYLGLKYELDLSHCIVVSFRSGNKHISY